MSRKQVAAALKASGIPFAHMAWPVNQAPDLPWCVFYLDEDSRLHADNRRWASYGSWIVELYQKAADSAVEEAVEDAVATAFGDYSKSETWVDSEDCLMTSYRFTVIERSQENG